MSDVKRYVVRGKTEDGAGGHFCAEVVLAYDYDRLEQECERLKRGLYDANDKAVEAWNARDAALKQVEGLRDLLRKVGPHFAAPPGLGYLHEEIDAATQDPTK